MVKITIIKERQQRLQINKTREKKITSMHVTTQELTRNKESKQTQEIERTRKRMCVCIAYIQREDFLYRYFHVKKKTRRIVLVHIE